MVTEVVNGVGAEDDAGVGEVGVGPDVGTTDSGTGEVAAASTLLAEAAPSDDPAIGWSGLHAQTRTMVDSRTEHLTTLRRSRTRRSSARQRRLPGEDASRVIRTDLIGSYALWPSTGVCTGRLSPIAAVTATSAATATIQAKVDGTLQPEKLLPSTAPNMSPKMEFGHPTLSQT